MSASRCWCFTVGVSVIVASATIWSPCVAVARETTSPSAEEIDLWIAQLGDDSFAIRQGAAERLLSGGYAAREALDAVADGPDPEVRFAARRLITLIDESEFSRRLDAFAADVDGRRGISLPGWREFSEIVGSDPPARALFVELQREEGPLLARFFDDSHRGGVPQADERIARLLNWPTITRTGNVGTPLGSCAAMYFLGTQPSANLSDSATSTLARLALMPPVTEAIAKKTGDNTVRRLVSQWVIRSPNAQSHSIHERLDLIFRYELTEALPLALAIVRSEPQYLATRPAHRVMAAQAIGRFGTVKDVPALEELLDDQEVCLMQPAQHGPQGFLRSVQVRDVALAMLLHLTKQELVGYGFLHAQPNPNFVYATESLGMESDEERDAAAAKWRTWRAKNALAARTVR